MYMYFRKKKEKGIKTFEDKPKGVNKEEKERKAKKNHFIMM